MLRVALPLNHFCPTHEHPIEVSHLTPIAGAEVCSLGCTNTTAKLAHRYTETRSCEQAQQVDDLDDNAQTGANRLKKNEPSVCSLPSSTQTSGASLVTRIVFLSLPIALPSPWR